MKKFFIETLGCKVNQYESSAISDSLISEGFELVSSFHNADIFIINTCTVTNRTDFKSRNLIRKALKFKENNPLKIVVVTGCYIQREKDEAISLGNIDLIIDNNQKNIIGLAIQELIECKSNDQNLKWFNPIEQFSKFTEIPSVTMGERSRAFIKIQDGCDFFCAYCAVPFARGKPRSRDQKSILEQIKKMTELGYREFVLAGINLGLYGIEFDSYLLSNLLEDICKIENVQKIRISSIEPQLLSDELIRIYSQNEKICSHFHIPLQSGCNYLLNKMGRKYNTSQFEILIDKILKVRPDTAFGFDVIVGLPGETDQMFAETFNLLKKIPLTYLHVFIYSKRDGTKAAKMPDQIHGQVAKERSARLLELSKQKLLEYRIKLINEKVKVGLIIEGFDSDLAYGTSDHFVKIWAKATNLNKGDLVIVKPVSLLQEGILAVYD